MEQQGPHALHENSVFVKGWCLVRLAASKTNCEPLIFVDTITAENYQNLLTHFMALLEENKRGCWCQRNWATAHIAKTTTAFFCGFSDDRTVVSGWLLATMITGPSTNRLLFVDVS
jgi:hypothetical protein